MISRRKLFKRRLTDNEEFEIMKLVLDKFLWLGAVFLGIGLYFAIDGGVQAGLWHLMAGIIIMVVFAAIIIKEFEHVR